MGVSGSAPASPAAPLCRPSAHISDPRSPSAGILRTPIEVLSSPLGSPQAGPAEPLPGTGQGRDPRSPTPGIFRTPVRTLSSGSLDSLVKQLSEAFGVGAAAPGPAPPGEACPAAESARRSSLPAGGPRPPACLGAEAGRPPSPSTVAVWQPRLAGPGFSSGGKPVRRKTNNKIMATSGGNGRSPLSILQDDNSPSATAPRQGKRHVLGENLGEKKEVTVDLSRSLKSGNCAWNDLNKENQQCPFVEN